MGKLRDKFRNMKRQEKIMLLFIILFVIAIITRWDYIKNEVSESFRHRFAPRERTDESKRIQTDAARRKAADTVPDGEWDDTDNTKDE